MCWKQNIWLESTGRNNNNFSIFLSVLLEIDANQCFFPKTGENKLKHIAEKLKLSLLTAFFAVAVFSAFIFIFYSSLSLPASEASVFSSNIKAEIPAVPQREQQKLQNCFSRTLMPNINSSQNRNNSNPPLNRAYEALFTRIYSGFTNALCICFYHQNRHALRQYFKTALPPRAGPFCC